MAIQESAKRKWFLIVALMLLLALQGSSASSRMGPVISRLRKKSDPDVMPAGKFGGPLEVSLNLNIINIASVDEAKGEIELLTWQTLSWRDGDLAWKPKDYLNVTTARIHSNYLWTPDITIFNGAAAPEEITPRLASVESDGTVTLLPSMRIRVLCDLSPMTPASLIANPGADKKTTCQIRLGSWTRTADLLALIEPDSNNIDTSGFFQGSQFELLELRADKNSFHYPCCVEPFEDLKFFFTFRRKSRRSLYDWSNDESFLNEKTRYG